MKTWTNEETKLLTDNYNNVTNTELYGIIPNKSHLAIYKKAYKLGFRKSAEIEWMNRSEARSGSKAPNWHGGRKQNKSGYVLVLDKNHHRAEKSGYVMEHIAVWESSNGRELPVGYSIHHKNGNKLDNRPENLEAMTIGEHTTLTHTGLKRSDETRRKISLKRREYYGKQNSIAG